MVVEALETIGMVMGWLLWVVGAAVLLFLVSWYYEDDDEDEPFY